MDDILLAEREEGLLLAAYAHLQRALEEQGLVVVPEKVQTEPPYSYLGHRLYPKAILPQKIQLRKDRLLTRNDFQKLLGDINGLRAYLKISTGELKALFDILKGDPAPTPKRELTEIGRLALQKVEQAIEQRVHYVDYSQGWAAYVQATTHTATAVLWQDGPLLWLHLPVLPARVLTP